MCILIDNIKMRPDKDLYVHDQRIIVITSFSIQMPIVIFLSALLLRIALFKLALWDVIILISLMIVANISWCLS